MRYTNPERRDWRMIIFVLPIGILLMLFAGQLAIRMIPLWSVNGDMRSGLAPDTAAGQDPSLLPPVSQDILTPMAWLYTFLTPGPESANSEISYPSMVVLEPTSTPTLTPVVTDTPATPSATSTASTPTFTATSTKKPPVVTDTPTATATATATATTPAPLCTDPTANNVGLPLPCTYDPPPTGYPSVLVGVSATPLAEFNEGGPDGSVGNVQDGTYVIVYLTGSPLIVNGPTDTNYDLAYYEIDNGSGNNIALDAVILSISKDNVTYYVVFNWGDGVPDTNSNVGDVAVSAGAEDDDQVIPSSELYGTAPLQSGVLIDVDSADSEPPPGEYRYLAIQAPLAPPNDFDDGTDIDSIEVVDVAP